MPSDIPWFKVSVLKFVGLEDIVQQYNIGGAILKIDCEGGEYEIIMGSGRDALRKFDAILLEYHYGYLNLKEKLEKDGFSVSLFKAPKYDRCAPWAHPNTRTGILIATREGK